MAVFEEKEFWRYVRRGGGIYSRIRKLMMNDFPDDEEKHLSRQAIRQRCIKDMEQLNDIRDNLIDEAEEALQTIIRTSNDDRVKLKAIEFFLSTIGKSRGYTRKIEVDGNQSHVINFKD